jgi:integrase
VIGARKPELGFAKALWVIPGERMKTGREHRVPLSKRALAIAKKAAEQDPEFLFPGRRAKHPLSNMAMAMLLRRLGNDGITVHGSRSTFKGWASECTAHSNEVTEMALAHAVGDEIEAAYRRDDLLEKRRGLMEDWAKFCRSKPVDGAKVVPIRRKRKQ